ncbi:MAG: hypothetical protein ACREV9_04240 [Burkholderiales bacterium]
MRKLPLILAALLALSACVPGRVQVDSISSVGSDEVLLVGRIELVPPLDPREQVLGKQAEQLRGKAHAVIADKWLELDGKSFSTYSAGAIVELGRDFYVSQRRTKELYYSGSIVLTRSTARSPDPDWIELPGGIKFKIGAADRAVYLGTIRYHRDAYNGITDVEFIDEYEQANREYVKRFGEQIKLRPAFPQPVKKLQAGLEELRQVWGLR